ncbi:MAG TPA: four helix bundle protein [Thermoanaerobaculia bacterium]|nr:four helix bundle protein [Thermoanaerobaculia bacterium]
MSTFEDLRAFQRAMDLTADIYNVTQAFPRTELYGLTSQLRRASSSVVSNIAEGQGQLTYGEWRNHLGRARGSLYEVQAQVLLSAKLGLLPQSIATHLQKQVQVAASELAGLIRWVRKREARAKAIRGNTVRTTDNRQLTTSQ